MTEQDLNEVVAGSAKHSGLRQRRPGTRDELLSDWDDVTLGNPLEPPRRGAAEVGEATRRAASNFQVGGSLHFEEVSSSFEEISRFATSELGYVLQIERHEGGVAGHDDTVVTVLRRVPSSLATRTPLGGTSAHRRLTSSAGSCTELSRSGFGVLRHPRWVDGFADRRVGRYAAVQDHGPPPVGYPGPRPLPQQQCPVRRGQPSLLVPDGDRLLEPRWTCRARSLRLPADEPATFQLNRHRPTAV